MLFISASLFNSAQASTSTQESVGSMTERLGLTGGESRASREGGGGARDGSGAGGDGGPGGRFRCVWEGEGRGRAGGWSGGFRVPGRPGR